MKQLRLCVVFRLTLSREPCSRALRVVFQTLSPLPLHMPDTDPAEALGTTLLDVFSVGGSTVPVFGVEGLLEEEGDHGASHSIPYQHIRVDSGMGQQNTAQTVFHELLHVISDMYGLGLKEGQVRVLEQVWTQIAKDSPKSLLRMFDSMRMAPVYPPIPEPAETGRNGAAASQRPLYSQLPAETGGWVEA